MCTSDVQRVHVDFFHNGLPAALQRTTRENTLQRENPELVHRCFMRRCVASSARLYVDWRKASAWIAGPRGRHSESRMDDGLTRQPSCFIGIGIFIFQHET